MIDGKSPKTAEMISEMKTNKKYHYDNRNKDSISKMGKIGQA